MRNFFLAVAIFISMIATTEAQNSFAYQAVIRTAQGELVSNQKVGMRFSLIYNKETVYCETHTPETNKYGNVQVEVGKGQKVSGDFAAVPWSTMQVMMKIEAAPAGGTNYIDLGTIQLQPAPYAMYAPTAGAVSTVQAGEPKSDGDALFEVKDKDGNVVFAVYPDGVRVFVDDSDSTANKAMSTGFAVQGRRAAKDGGDANIFAVNTSGTQVFVGEGDTAEGKPVSTGFAVQGRRAAKDGSSDLFKVSSTGTQIYIGEQDGKPVSTGFAVQGRRAAKDGENDKYLEINPDGTRVYIDDADSASGKPVSTGFAVQGRRAAKGDSDSKYLEINANGTQVFVDDTDDKPVSTGFAVQGRRAAKGNEPKLFEVNQYGTQIYIDTKKGKPVSTGFAVQGRRAGKNANTNKYMVIDADGTRVYVDYEEAKAMQTGFAVQGRRAAKDGAQNTILEVNNVDGTRVFIDDIDGKAMPTGFAVSGRRAGKEDNNFLDINNNKITLANKQLAVGNTTTEANTLVMTGESTTIVTDVFLLAEKETEEPLLIADNKSGVDVNTNLVVRGEVGQNVKTEEVEDAAPDTIMVASVIETLACAELAAALGDADGYALLKIHGNGLFTQPQELDAAGNTSILFDVYGKMTTYRESAVVAVIMTNAATPDAKVLIWPLKQTNGTNISFGLTTAGGTDQYVNVLACINAKGGVECKFNAIASDSNLGEVKCEGTKVYGDVVRIEATTIKKGYHFAGWSDGVGTNPRSVMVAGDSTITALFEPNPYNVTLTATNGHIEGAESGIFHYGTRLTLEAVADDHYHFVDWNNGSTDNPYTLEVEDDLELTANFAIDKYTVTFDANGGVIAEGASTTNVTYNQSIGAFPAVERNGFIFTGWADDKGNTVVKETLVTGKVTLYAQWLQTTYYVADADNNGSADGDGTSENPYASINNALEEMIDNGTDTVYTICVKGTLAKDNTVIPEGLNGKIRRLIIEGDGGQMEINESTGESQYVPGGTLTKASEYGRVLGVATSVPVTLRNITVTGGKLDEDDRHGAGIFVDEKADVTIADSAYIVGNAAFGDWDGSGSGVYVIGKLTMTGGEISNNEYAIYGGGVYVAGEFTMTGGTISGNSAGDGGGVFVAGKFTMTGGTISDSPEGGAVFVCSDGSFLMGGSAYIPTYDINGKTYNDVNLEDAHITIISDLKAKAPVATINIVNRNYSVTADDYKSKVLAYPEGNDGEEDMTLLKNNYTKFAILPRYYYDYSTINKFYYDYRILETGYLQHFCSLILYENEDETTPYGEPQTLVEGDILEKSPEHRDKEGYQFLGWHRRKWNGREGFKTDVDSLEFPYAVGYEDDTIVLVGQWAQNVFYVKQDGNDSNGGTNSTDDALATIDGAVRKMCNSNVDYTIVVSGTLKGIQTIADQIIENVDSHGDPFTINPIIANKITLCGDTINSEDDIIDGGWFLDDSGSEPEPNNRYGNEMREGSALTINTLVPVIIKKLTITGGYVLGGNGGGIYASNYSNIEIGNGALITDNYCSMNLNTEVGGYGGGVFLAPNANLSLTSEGLISENAAVNGGGVFVAENATFNIRGGLITGNGSSYGGGIYNKGSLAMTDGTIYANMVDQNGGGVYVDSSAVFAMGGGSIDNNDATKCGGGVFINGGRYGFGTMYMCDSAIVGRKVDETSSALSNAFMNSNQAANGGGVYVEGYASLYMGYSDSEHEAELKGGIFYNYANSAGGGVYVNYGQEHGTLNVASGYIASNGVRDFGAGVYLAANSNSDYSAVLNMKGGIIRGNDANGVNGKGSGVYMGVDDNYSSKFNISGAATVADGNDVYMSGEAATISIVGAISNQADVAKLTLAQHTNGRQLIRKENDDVTDEVFTAAIGKFTVAPYKVDESTTEYQEWYVDDEGKLQKKLKVIFEGCDNLVEPQYLVGGQKATQPDYSPEEMSYDGITYSFSGWYTYDNNQYVPFSFDSQIVRDTVIHALLGCNYYVENGGNGNGSSTSPFGSIADAIERMTSVSTIFTVNIVGDLEEAQTIWDVVQDGGDVFYTTPMAAQINLRGAGTNKIDANEEGSALTISTVVPVTIENLTITGGYAENGGGINVTNNANVTLGNGVLITGNFSDNYGGGVYVGNNSLVTITGSCSITDNIVDRTQSSNYISYPFYNNGKGGGVAVCGVSILKMTGGSITNNKAVGHGVGGGVYIDGGDRVDAGIFEMTGGTISDNNIYDADNYSQVPSMGDGVFAYVGSEFGTQFCAKFIIGGNAIISDTVAFFYESTGYSYSTVMVESDLAEGTSIPITFDSYNIGWTILYKPENSEVDLSKVCEKFDVVPVYSNKTGDTELFYINAEGELQKYIAVRFRDCDGVATQYFKPGGEETIQEPEPTHETVEGVTFNFKGWYVWNGATNEYDKFTSFNTVPTGDIEIWALWDAEITVTNGGTVGSLEAAAGLMTKNDYDYTIKINGTLSGPQTISSAMANSITITGANELVDGNPQDIINGNSNGSVLTISTSVPVTIEKLKITGGINSEGNGGGLYIGSSAKVTLGNNAIVGEKGSSSAATSSACANSANRGGGVYVDGGTLTLEDGSVIGHNFASGITAGGVYVTGEGHLYIRQGAKIEYNGSVYYSGGVYIDQYAMAEMTGGEISHNDTKAWGGGIRIEGIFTMSGGTISNNVVNTYIDGNGYAGGGVMIEGDGTFNMHGTASIIGNFTKGSQGGAVKVGDEGTFRMTGGTIIGNAAEACSNGTGNGIRVESSKFYIGDSAFIASNNVVQLKCPENHPESPNKVNIISPLKNANVATITYEYSGEGIPVLAIPAGSTASLTDEYAKFLVTPSVSGTTMTKWMVNNEGKLQQSQQVELAVDLGLSSQTLWATCNVGATSPEEYGDYFAWGETIPYYTSLDPITYRYNRQNGYSWASYSFTNDGGSTFTKYTDSNSATLESADDAATANWGSVWAMPTQSDFRELIEQCYWKWTTQYNGSHKGYIVYKSKDKSKDNGLNHFSDYSYSPDTDVHIFLPAAGFIDGEGRNNIDSYGYYWSASLHSTAQNAAWLLGFGPGYHGYEDVYDRYKGFPVRAVKRP